MPRPRMLTCTSSHFVFAVCLVVAGMLASSAILHESPLFKAPYYLFESGQSPTSVAIADLNEDGRPDLAVTHSGDSHAVAVLLGNCS